MWVKQCHKPHMTGNGNHTTNENGDLGGGLLLLKPQFIIIIVNILSLVLLPPGRGC